MKLKVKKRSIIMEAIQWTGSNFEEIKEFAGFYIFMDDTYFGTNKLKMLRVNSPFGFLVADIGDYIIRKSEDKFWLESEKNFTDSYQNTEYKADDEDVIKVEEAVGMGCGAWDTINPKDIIDAAYMVMKNKEAK